MLLDTVPGQTEIRPVFLYWLMYGKRTFRCFQARGCCSTTLSLLLLFYRDRVGQGIETQNPGRFLLCGYVRLWNFDFWVKTSLTYVQYKYCSYCSSLMFSIRFCVSTHHHRRCVVLAFVVSNWKLDEIKSAIITQQPCASKTNQVATTPFIFQTVLGNECPQQLRPE